MADLIELIGLYLDQVLQNNEREKAIQALSLMLLMFSNIL